MKKVTGDRVGGTNENMTVVCLRMSKKRYVVAIFGLCTELKNSEAGLKNRR